MCEKERNGRNVGFVSEIIMIALMMGLSMMLGIRVYCKEWLEAASCLLWIACWAVWYGIWKKYSSY